MTMPARLLLQRFIFDVAGEMEWSENESEFNDLSDLLVSLKAIRDHE